MVRKMVKFEKKMLIDAKLTCVVTISTLQKEGIFPFLFFLKGLPIAYWILDGVHAMDK